MEISPTPPVFHSTASVEAADSMTEHPAYQEVILAIKRLQNNKSQMLAEHQCIVLQNVWSEEELPPE